MKFNFEESFDYETAVSEGNVCLQADYCETMEQ